MHYFSFSNYNPEIFCIVKRAIRLLKNLMVRLIFIKTNNKLIKVTNNNFYLNIWQFGGVVPIFLYGKVVNWYVEKRNRIPNLPSITESDANLFKKSKTWTPYIRSRVSIEHCGFFIISNCFFDLHLVGCSNSYGKR